tara:strand:- start:1483 stop:1773 length:291 start_codon:yes stop_codon:yes gene_type:complete
MKVQYKLSIEQSGYVILAEIHDDKEVIVETISKQIAFSQFDKMVKYSQEELELKIKVEEIVKKALFKTATDILQEDVDKCLEKLTPVINGSIVTTP